MSMAISARGARIAILESLRATGRICRVFLDVSKLSAPSKRHGLMKICVVTSHGISEPRGPRHALAAKVAFPDAEVVFLHYESSDYLTAKTGSPLLQQNDIYCRVLTFPTRSGAPVKWLARKLITKLCRTFYAATGVVSQAIFSERTIGLTRVLLRTQAQVYIAHNFETLLPAALTAERTGAALVFDCMEFYSDMGDGQRADVSQAIGEIESRYLPRSELVIAASEQLASAYSEAYGIRVPLAACNASPTCFDLPQRKGGALNLYWRNSVLGFGQRGLEEILAAIARLPSDVHLHLQGHLGHDGGTALRDRITELGISAKVSILPPHPLGAAVSSAARFDIGLCLERRGPRNHDLTVSNKMFDYHMAGLAVIASDLPGLAAVIRRSRGGLLYEPGNIQALCVAVEALRSNPGRLAEMQQNARQFALREGNMEVEIERVAEALKTCLSKGITRVYSSGPLT